MLSRIFSNPKRLFVCLFILTVYGIYSGLKLPISMYPNTSKPSVNMWVPYGSFSQEAFRVKFGNQIESKIKKSSDSENTIDKIEANYEKEGAYYKVEYSWNADFEKALSSLQNVASAMAGVLPTEISDRIGVWQRNRNAGFFAASLYAPGMSLQELYKVISPILQSELDNIQDAENPSIWNPESYVISISLIPEKLAKHGIFPRQIERAVNESITSYSGSSVKVGENNHKFNIEADLQSVEDLAHLTIIHKGKPLYLSNLANISFGKDLHRERSFKTNGVNSLILFAKPKSGGNVRKMSQDILKVLEVKAHLLPKTLKTKIIVDPAAVINTSVKNLIKDVIVAALMAVLVLFMFIGGIRNIGTAVIEIPLCMVLSFICMKYVGMNLNLISLGGLALAAGMNVDASIVIMENIFKHRALWAKQNRSCDTFAQRLELVHSAVKEVSIPVILSITTTLIVFIPMAFTSDLTNAILGDLARAVIFSHAISGFVALIVVPTVRVIVLKKYDEKQQAPLEKPLQAFANSYEKILSKLLDFKYAKITFIAITFITLAGLITFLLPKLPKEVIGKPSSDWAYMYINAMDTQSSRHMENVLQEVENTALKEIGDIVDYTWVEKHTRNGGQIMFKLFDRSKMKFVQEKLKEKFINTPSRSFYIDEWNPSELPLPPENHFLAKITGDEKEIYNTASRLRAFLREEDTYDRVRANPGANKAHVLSFSMDAYRWSQLRQNGIDIYPSDIAEISQISKSPKRLGEIKFNDQSTTIKMSLSDERYIEPELLESFPINIQNKIIPLSALGTFETIKEPSVILIKDGQPTITITATLDESSKDWESKLKIIQQRIRDNMESLTAGTKTQIEMTNPQEDLASALKQLSNSLLFSIFLIFFVLWLQFQSIKQVSIIMMTVPLGIIGVISSLYLFDSYLSLNSALGIILLNGITVNNSILLTDVTNSLRNKGLRGKDLIITASKKRLRPILITSLTTILGMFPVALGLGDGGKILQPLGIAVTSGLFIATGMTLLIVPLLLYREENNLVFTTEDVNIATPAEFKSEARPIL